MVLNSNVMEFKKKIIQDNIWQFYMIKAVAARSSCNNPWKIIWLLVMPQRLGPPSCNILLDNPTIKFIEEVRSFSSIDSFLSDIFANTRVQIGSTEVSLDLLKFESERRHLNRYESKAFTGTEFPGELLFVKGPDPKSDIFSLLKTAADNALLINDPPFENVEDAVNELFKVNPTPLSDNHLGIRGEFIRVDFRALLMVLDPYPIRIESTAIVKDDLVIEIILGNDIDPNSVKLSIIGKMRHKPIRQLVEFNGTQIDSETPIIRKIPIGEEPGLLRLRLFFKHKVLDQIDLSRRVPSQKPDWFNAVLNRIDPNYEALEVWIGGKGKQASDDFERGVTMLFSLCGLSAIHVGGGYENATLNKRRRHFANPDTASDILLWSSRHLYVCQCSLGKEQIKAKVESLVTFKTELDRIILDNYETKPEIYPVVVSNIDAKLLLTTDRIDAESKHVKILTGYDLLQLLSHIKNNEIITQDQLHNLLTVRRTLSLEGYS